MDRYRIRTIIIFLTFLIMMYRVDGFINEAPLMNKVIYIDPGHGGVDPGANYKDIYEKTINLEIAKLIVASLEEKGAIVYLTREDDYDLAVPNAYLRKRSDLSQRAKMINKSNCDLFLSVHLNASHTTSWKGAQVFYSEVNEENEKIADIIQGVFNKKLGSKRKQKKLYDLYMYKHVTRPGVLLEVGFISNPNERYLLRQPYYQKKVVKAITEGVLLYFK